MLLGAFEDSPHRSVRESDSKSKHDRKHPVYATPALRKTPGIKCAPCHSSDAMISRPKYIATASHPNAESLSDFTSTSFISKPALLHQDTVVLHIPHHAAAQRVPHIALEHLPVRLQIFRSLLVERIRSIGLKEQELDRLRQHASQPLCIAQSRSIPASPQSPRSD